MPSKSPILMLFELLDGISPSIYQIGYQELYKKT